MEEGEFSAVCVRCLIAQVHSGCRCRSKSAAKCVEAKDTHVNSFNAVLFISKNPTVVMLLCVVMMVQL